MSLLLPGCFLFLSYLLLCRVLRFRRRDELQRPFPDRESLSRMTNVEAQRIMNILSEKEFPFIILTSIQFGLFMTYGIPTISQLLHETKQLGDPRNSDKRYTDTSVLISELADHPPQSDRAIKAIARMNYIHSRYLKAGRISNDDLLYTLSVFFTQPIGWVARYEWREMSDVEKCALATFWKSIGDSMSISYHDLDHYETWSDGLQFYEDIKKWAEEYEIRAMVPAKSNEQIANELVPLLIFYVPMAVRPFATKIIAAVMGERLRSAMKLPAPPEYYTHIVDSVFLVRSLFLRHLSLPRPDFMRVAFSTDEDPKTNMYYQCGYLANPYYTRPGFWNNWGPSAWFKWYMGGYLPTKGGLYNPEGYRIEEIGPKSMFGKGGDEMRKMEEKIRAERPMGCPFSYKA